MSIKIGFKRLHTRAEVPKKKHEDDAGFDIVTPYNFTVEPGPPVIIPTGFAVEIPKGYCMRIIPRSGLASRGLTITNSPALIDSNYKGEVGVIFQSTNGIFGFNAGERVCQVTFEKVLDIEFEVIDELSESDRG